MGREIKRVPLDFDWPLNEVWEGFIQPEYESRQQCSDCNGSGYGPEANNLHDQWYGNAPFTPEHPFTYLNPAIQALAKRNGGGIYEELRLTRHFNSGLMHHLNDDDVKALVDANRLMDFTHRPRPDTPPDAPRWENGWLKESNGYIPTTTEVNQWSLSGFGHDSINCHIVIKSRCQRLGVSETCATCQGHGEVWLNESEKAAYEAWKETEPPTGEGYQMWETVSEGSPVSPVMPTREAMIDWLINEGHRRGAAEKFVEEAWAPSMMLGPNGLKSGVDVYDEEAS
jgi:hypothetical protein